MAKSTFQITLTPDQIGKLSKQGFSSTSGTLPETSGVVLSYVIEGTVATVTIEKKPFYVPVSAIVSHVQNLLTEG